MALDLNNEFDEIKGKIKSGQKYKKISKQIKDIEKKSGDAETASNKFFSESLNSAKTKASEAFNSSAVKNQYDKLIELVRNPETGNETIDILLKAMLDASREVKNQLPTLLADSTIKALGCEQEQQYIPNEKIYIKLDSIDLLEYLKYSPDNNKTKILYEKESLSIQNNPFSMNRELYNRTQSDQSYSEQYGQFYKGFSNQDLFDIKYVVQDQNTGNYGDFFEVTLQPKLNSPTLVADFLVDYYQSIQIFDFSDIVKNSLNVLTSSVDMDLEVGSKKLEDVSVALKIIQRILGLCFDNTQEIEVGGTSKVSILEEIDESFFELTEFELRDVNNDVNNTLNRVVEFEDCGNVKLPIDYNQVVNSISNIWENAGDKTDEQLQEELIEAIKDISQNPEWGPSLPTIDFNLVLNLEIIKQLPKIIVMSLISPKVLLPIFIMFKALKQNFVDAVEDFQTFLREMRNIMVVLISEIQAKFKEVLVVLIKKQIYNLIVSLNKDISEKSKNTYIIIITKLLSIAFVVVNLIRDYKRCRSITDELLTLLRLLAPKLKIPLPALAFSSLLEGFSAVRAFNNHTETLDKLGYPTGDLPDGSPNLGLIHDFSLISAYKREMDENSKVQVSTINLGSPSQPLISIAGPYLSPASLFGKLI
jgi:hypothetical protein